MDCKNCEASLNSKINYCPLCGAKIVRKRITLKNLWHDISLQFFNLENNLLKTFLHLFIQPEAVIYGYISGTRKKYITVIQYLAISLTLLGLQLFILNKFYPDFLNFQFIGYDEYLAMYPKESRLKTEEVMTNYFNFINEYQSLVYVIGIPFTAFITYLAFVKEKLLNFAEHIVLNTYITAQYVAFSFFTYLTFAILNLDINILTTLSLLVFVFYYGFVFYKIYKLSVATIILRFMLSLVIICAIFLLFFIVGIITTIVYLKFFK
jgi:hypothetical protein